MRIQRMPVLRVYFVGLLGLLSVPGVHAQNDVPKLADGLYRVLDRGSKQEDLAEESDAQVAAPALHTGGWPNEATETWYLVPREPDIPLEFAAEPEIITSLPGDRRLRVRLADKLKEPLLRFTTAQLGNQVAVIVQGQVVMSPTIRAPIAEASLEISTCNGDVAQLKEALWPPGKGH